MTPSAHDERRNFHRILFDAPSSLTCEENRIPVTLHDLSLSGALLNTPENWDAPLGSEVILDVQLSKDQHIVMQAEIAHISTQWLGLRCRHIDMESISHLRRLVELNLGDATLLERELEALG